MSSSNFESVDKINQNTYENAAEARRTTLVDDTGNAVGPSNPLPVQITDGTDTADVIPTNGLKGVVAIAPGHISTDNSTSTPLSGDAVFTGTFEDITNFGVIVITLNSSHASITDGLCIDFSSDGVNIDSQDKFTVPANTGKTFSFQAATKYFRVVYTNGSTLQTHFRLQTTLKPYYVKPSSHRISDNISPEDDAELVKAILTGQKPNNDFVNFQSTTAGNFKVSVEEIQNKISDNNSTTDVLSGDAIFTGDGDDVENFANVTIQLDSSHDSAIDGMTFQFSIDNTNWDDVCNFTYTASEGARRFQFPVTAKYFRIVYTNGSTLQTHFRVQTILHVSDILTSIHRLKDDTSSDRSVQIIKSALMARDGSTGNLKLLDSTTAGNFKTSIEEYNAAVDPIRKDIEGGGKVSVGTSAVEVTFTGAPHSIIIRADRNNTGLLFIGESNVTNTGANSLTYLEAGDSLTIDYDDADNAVYVVSDTASQNFYKGALL